MHISKFGVMELASTHDTLELYIKDGDISFLLIH